MPYFITDKSADCSGWAVIDDKGKAFGCHQTKQDAIDQGVAISLADNKPFMGERAAVDSLAVGDYVSWDVLDPEVLAQVEALQGDVAVIRIFECEDSVFSASDLLMLMNVFKLEKVSAPDLLAVEVDATDTAMPEPVMDATDYSMLNERQQEMVDETSGIAAEYGQFNQGTGADGAHYAPGDKNPFKSEGLQCGNCVFFNEITRQCQVVEGSIDPEGICKLWVIPESELVAPDMANRAAGEKVIIVDIDGTIVSGGRLVQRVWDFIQGLDGAVFIVTGRPESDRANTVKELADLGVTYSRLIMNPGSTADSVAYKKETAMKLQDSYDVVAAVENNPDAIRAYRDLGIETYNPSAVRDWQGFANRFVGKLESGDEVIENRGKWLNAAWAIKATIEGGTDEARQLGKTEQRVNVANLEVREGGDGMTFEGYAAVFNSDSEPLPFIERIQPGAFKRSLQSRNEIKLLWNHDAGEPLASVRGGTLKLWEDATGLRVWAQLANTTRGRDVAELIRSGTIDSMSFGFNVIKDSWNEDGSVRTLESVRIFETSLVAFPAYTATAGTVSVREQRNIDADKLADSLAKLESGAELDSAQADLIKTVVDKLTAKGEESVEPDNGFDLVKLQQMKLKLLEKGI